MIKTKTTKQTRIEIRVNRENKNLIEKAAQFVGESTSSYMLRHSLKAAIGDVKEHETLILTGNDRELFHSLITSPLKPNKNLVNLMNNNPSK